MNLEDVGAALKVGQAKFNLAVKAARSHQGGVEGIGSVKNGNEPSFKILAGHGISLINTHL